MEERRDPSDREFLRNWLVIYAMVVGGIVGLAIALGIGWRVLTWIAGLGG